MQKLGGFLDFAIVGSGDSLMRWSFEGTAPHQFLEKLNLTESFEEAVRQWATPACPARLGYLPGLLYHHYHGKTQNRQYDSDGKFCPGTGFPQRKICSGTAPV